MVGEHPDYTLSEYCELWLERTGIDMSESTMCTFEPALSPAGREITVIRG